MEIFHYWRIIRQRLPMIFSVILFSVLVTGFVSFFLLKPEYEATATLLVQSQKDSNQQVYDNLMANEQYAKTYGEIIKSRQVADDVLNQLQLKMTPDQLLSKVNVTTTTGSIVTSIVVTDHDPKMAATLANAFAQTFHDHLSSIMKVDNVSILDLANVDAKPSPVRPKPYFNMAIAFVLGLVVGVIVAFVLDFMDNTVKDENDIHELLSLPVLGVVVTIGAEEKKNNKKRKKHSNQRQIHLGGETNGL